MQAGPSIHGRAGLTVDQRSGRPNVPSKRTSAAKGGSNTPEPKSLQAKRDLTDLNRLRDLQVLRSSLPIEDGHSKTFHRSMGPIRGCGYSRGRSAPTRRNSQAGWHLCPAGILVITRFYSIHALAVEGSGDHELVTKPRGLQASGPSCPLEPFTHRVTWPSASTACIRRLLFTEKSPSPSGIPSGSFLCAIGEHAAAGRSRSTGTWFHLSPRMPPGPTGFRPMASLAEGRPADRGRSAAKRERASVLTRRALREFADRLHLPTTPRSRSRSRLRLTQ